MIRSTPQCVMCKHWVSPFDRADADARQPEPTQVCDAFPLDEGGIPDDIWWNRADHRQPVEGDHDIQWTPSDSDASFPESEMVPSAIRSSAPGEPHHYTLTDAEPDGPDAEDVTDEVAAAAGHDTTPGHDQLHHWWTVGPGLALWIESPHQFTTLRDHLVKYVPLEQANRMAAAWVHEVTGAWPGSDVHRVEEGGKPRGSRIGPG